MPRPTKRNNHGLAVPALAATLAGKVKIPAPTTEFNASRAIPMNPIVRTNFLQ